MFSSITLNQNLTVDISMWMMQPCSYRWLSQPTIKNCVRTASCKRDWPVLPRPDMLLTTSTLATAANKQSQIMMSFHHGSCHVPYLVVSSVYRALHMLPSLVIRLS